MMISPLSKLLRWVKHWYWDLWFDTDSYYDYKRGDE